MRSMTVKVALVGKEAWQEFEKKCSSSVLGSALERTSQPARYASSRHSFTRLCSARSSLSRNTKTRSVRIQCSLLQTVGEDVTRVLMNVQIRQPTPEEQAQQQAMQAQEAHVDESEGQLKGPMFEQEAEEAEKFAHVGRNDPCPCGSGRSSKTATEN